jgi:hypothetical protein
VGGVETLGRYWKGPRKGGVQRRKVADCRDWPSEVNCTLTISGEEEVVRAAEHAVSVHSETDTPELHAQIRSALKDEAMSGA